MKAIMTEILYEHVIKNEALPHEQRALVRGKRGCLDALHIDKMMCSEVKEQNGNLSVAWIDYQKAYDRVPHQWVMDLVKIIRAPKMVSNTIKHIVPMWASTFMINKERQRSFDIMLKRGVFQGDSISPLLFCLAIAPIPEMLRTTQGKWCN